MKIVNEQSTIMRGGVHGEHEFTVKATGKAFEILSSGLYTDPVLAVVRELSCNARDAHIAADEKNGTNQADVPFLIHLPNYSEPFFEVTDYGIGMSEDDILTIYTTYFESTKDDSNSFIGALGLGSKSPFAYSDAFQVVSNWNGTKTTYSIFLNEDRIPSIAKMAEVETNKPNGLAVRLSVKSGDFTAFENRTSYILKYFPTLPEIIGGSGHFAFEKLPDNPITGDGWFVDTTTNRHGSNFTAVMGGVPYKVSLSQLTEHTTDEQREFLNNVRIVAYYELGELNIPPSREEIRYDKKSVACLANTCRTIQLDIAKRVEERVVDMEQPSDWEAFRNIHAFVQESFNFSHGSLSSFVHKEDVTNLLLLRYLTSRGKFLIDSADWEYHTLRQYVAPRHDSMMLGRPNVEKQTTAHPYTNPVVIILDVGTGGIKRMHEWWKKEKYRNAIVIRLNDMKNPPGNQSAELDLILDAMGNPPTVRVSDMPAPPKKTRAQAAAVKVTFLKFGGCTGGYYNRSSRRVFDQVPEDKAPTTGLYYLCARGTTPHFGTNTSSKKVHWKGEFGDTMVDMVKFINLAKGTTYTIDDVYGVNGPQCRSTISKDPKWTNIFELVSECLHIMKDTMEVNQRLKATDDYMNMQSTLASDLDKKYFATLKPTSPFRVGFDEMRADRERVKDTYDMIDSAWLIDKALNGYGSDSMFSDSKHDIKPYYDTDDFDQMYPMLTYVNSSYYNRRNRETMFEHVFSYINQIDGNTNV